jgi:hypothetical protein
MSTDMKRESLDGVWILDKTRGKWSMRSYLETLHVTELAIQAHEKGELEQDTIHKIEMDLENLKITKRSRVNNDLVVELKLGEEKVEYLKPGQRPKKTVAISEDPTHLEIRSSLLTMNGMAHVTDIKKLTQEDDKSVLVQHLTIVNEQTGQSNTTTRFYLPHDKLEVEEQEE